ncbi:MAG TPA: carboxypeptidase regulatory-like domain-containing protein [Dehalococcoidia bacterium]|nr:carboxypeptidase regulatory-like domain-containing protein [Dehalococcoidia bacterium]
MGTKAKVVFGTGLGALALWGLARVVKAKPKPPLPPANIVVSNLLISPTEVEVGQDVTVSVDVTNIGQTAGSYTVVAEVYARERADRKRTVDLQPGETKTVPFIFTPTEPGEYTVEVGDLAGSFRCVQRTGYLIGYVISVESAVVGTDIPIAGATVQAGEYSATTDSEGYFELELPAGTQQVDVLAEGYESQSVALTVVGGQTTEQWFYLNRTFEGGAGGIGGYVKAQGGTGIVGATVTVGPYSTITVENGHYFMQVPPGDYVVIASAPGYQSASKTATVNKNRNTSVPTFSLVPLMTGESKIRDVLLSQPHSGHPYYNWLVANQLQWGWQLIYPDGSVTLGGEAGAPSAVGCKCSVQAFVTKQSKYWKFGDLIVTRPDGATEYAHYSGSGLDYTMWTVNFNQQGTYRGSLELFSSTDKVNWIKTDEVNFTLAKVV